MKGLQNHKLLQEIDLEENQVCELIHHTDMNYSVGAVRSKNWNVRDLLQSIYWQFLDELCYEAVLVTKMQANGAFNLLLIIILLFLVDN